MNGSKTFALSLSLITTFFLAATASYSQQLKLRYSPTADNVNSTHITDASGNGYDGTLLNGAKVATYDNMPVIDLGANNGYVDMGASAGKLISTLSDFTIYTKLFIPSSTDLNKPGNFVWSFANSNDIGSAANGCQFFSARNSRYAITRTNWSKESGFDTGTPLNKGSWRHIIYIQKGDIGTLYIDGIPVKTGTIKLSLSSLGATTYNYLGRSCYNGDAYLAEAKFADFRIYDGALSDPEIEKITGIRKSSPVTSVLAEFDFSGTTDKSGMYKGALQNGAKLIEYAGGSVLSLGNENGYFDLSADFGKVISLLDSFSISVNILVPAGSSLNNDGNFIWTFANSADMGSAGNGSMFLRATKTRYAISKNSYHNETSVHANKPMPLNRWVNVTYTQRGQHGFFYIDGVLAGNSAVGVKPKDLWVTTHNYLGRSCYKADTYLKDALYDHLWIYRGAVGESEIKKLTASLEKLNHYEDQRIVARSAEKLDIGGKDSVRSRILLPARMDNDIIVKWKSSNEKAVLPDGTIFRPAHGKRAERVILTATLTRNQASTTKEVEVTVMPQYPDATCVEMDLASISIKGNTLNARTRLTLPNKAAEGSVIRWTSGSPDFVNASGRVLKLSPRGKGKKKVTLTATVSKGAATKSKDFIVYVAEEEDRYAYLFTYFTGNAQHQEQIRFALSYDGLHYIPLNNGEPVINSSDISVKKAVRDPHILRGEDGKTFYMVVTDMKSSEGWASNRGIVLLKSTDLVHWTHATIHFPARWPNQWANVTRVWAPQTIYDHKAGKYMVYFSLLTSDGKCPYDKIFYCYANKDFTDLEGEPKFLFDRGSATIDGDIVYTEEDRLYHLFFKNENASGICKVTATSLTAEEGKPDGSQWSKPSDNLEQTNEAVEGAGVFRLINSDDWVLMYDCYGAHHYQFCKSSDLKTFSFVVNNAYMDARHGTTIAISEEEAKRLVNAFPSKTLTELTIGARNNNIKSTGITIDESAKEIFIPVYHGTDLSSFNPMFYATPGTKITPSGAQNFSSKSVGYTFTFNGKKTIYKVSAAVQVNPIIPDFHADPEVLYSQKTGLFYIYPTTDGFQGWGGFSFDVFSSPDLVNWTNEGRIIDMKVKQVPWATGNAWAPCIEEKKISDSDYLYYFYFSGESGGRKKIGVAVSENPAGPFVDSGAPMLNTTPPDTGGQIIDGDVFTDPQTGKSYFYWGNGFMAVSELNDDMITVKDGTTRVITPEGGTLETYAFREGAYVFYRKGTYYFLWSVDDTGSPNYHVAYGTSTSPTGPIQVAKDPVVIKQDPGQSIYGTAHNSILQIPGTDEWYIVYHRINPRHLKDEPGTHREVCIDRLYFNDDGTIKEVVPTQKGIAPWVKK